MATMDTLRERFEVRPGRHRPNTLRTGAIGLAVIVLAAVCGGYMSVTGYLPFLPRGGNLVRADFDTAFNLNTSTPVRIKGIGVGEVDSIQSRDGGRSARVVMRVDDRAERLLKADARAAVWSRLVLGGNSYIELTPGRSRAKLGDTAIPLSRTSTQVGIDQVIGAFTPGARQGLVQTIAGLRTTFSDPPSVGAAADGLAPGIAPLAPAIRGLRGRRNGDLGDVVQGFDSLAKSVGHDEGQLAGLIDGADATLAVTAARRADLGRTLDLAPAALRTTRTQLAGVNRTLDVLDPLARELRPGARRVAPALTSLRPALTDTRRLLARARPLVAELDPAVRSLRRTARQGVPLMNEIQGTVTRTKDSLLPFLDSEDPSTHLKQYELPGPTVAAVDSLSGLFDKGGHVAHFMPTLGSRALHDYVPCEVYATDPDPTRRLNCQAVGDFVLSIFNGGQRLSPASLRRLTTLAKAAK